MNLTQNFFELFDLPVAFDVNLEQVSERYRELQKQTHPDKFATADAADQRQAVQLTAHLNEALQTLKKPLKRAQYLLSLQGIDTEFESNTRMDMDFLMTQMALRERLDEVRSHSDPETELEAIAEDVAGHTHRQQQDFCAHYQQQDWTQAKESVRQWQFLDKLMQEIDKVEDDLLD